jgi:acetyltransferase-like isoleucine patch superfamily enzyme
MHLGERFYPREELEKAGFGALGENVLIKRNCGLFFTENLFIGSNVRIDDFTIIVASGPCHIGSYVVMASHCYLAASDGIEVGDFCGLAPGVKLFSGSDDYSGTKMTNAMVGGEYIGGPGGKVVLNRHVIIGAGSVVLPKVTIGEGASIGALSLVNKDVAPWTMNAGIPARTIRPRKQDLLALEARFLAEKK